MIEQQRFHDALRIAQMALALARNGLGPSAVALCLCNLGAIHQALSNVAESHQLLLEAVRLLENTTPIDCETLGDALTNLGRAIAC